MRTKATRWRAIFISVLLSYPVHMACSQQAGIDTVYDIEQNWANKKQYASNYIQLTTDSVHSETAWPLTSMIKDQGRFWSSPFRISRKDLYFWIPVISATTITIIYDEEIYSAIKRFQNNHALISEISPVITLGGGYIFIISTGSLFLLTGILSGNQKTEQTGLMVLQTFIHTGFIVQIGKMLTGRQRPSFEDGLDKWHGFPESLKKYNGEFSSKYDAFPSGHTIEAWALATVIAEQYREIKIVPVIAYTFATGVGLSRITEDTHWLSDVILGAALGYSIGKFMVREHSNTHWTLLPCSTGNSASITALYRF